MKIQQLLLRNVRNIKELDLDFRDPVTGKPMSRVVLAGANGSGKTTILEAIFGLLSAAQKYGNGGIDFYSRLQDTAIEFSPHCQLQLIFEVGLSDEAPMTLSVSYGDKGAVVGDSAILESAEVGGHLPSLGGRQIEWLGRLEDSSLFRKLAAFVQNASQREGESAGSVLYFPFSRDLVPALQGELGYEPKPYKWAYRYQSNDKWKGSLESYLFSLNYLDLEDRDRKISANRFSQTVELVNSIFNDKRVAHIEKGRVVIETNHGQKHGLDDLSSGEKQIVLLLIEIARYVVPGSVLLIDEPEISLHEAWQRGLMAALDKIIEQYDAQVILATHSVEIATCVMPHEVISLNNLGLPLGQWEPEKEAIP